MCSHANPYNKENERQLQTISSRRVAPVDPVVVTVGCLSAGTAENVIPNEAVMEGTVRTQAPDTRKQVAEKIGRAHV